MLPDPHTTDECLTDHVALFQSLPILTSEEESYFIKLNPISSLQLEAPLHYEYDVPENFYADLSRCYQYLKCRIVDSNHQPIPATAAGQVPNAKSQVYPINYFGNTCFSNVEIFLNNTQIGSSNNLYPYRALYETLLSFDESTKDTQLAMGMFFPDKEAIDFAAIGYTRYSSPFETFTKLHLDLCSQNKYILNKTNIKIKCYRALNSFALMAKSNDNKYKIIFEEAFVYLRIVRLRESLRLAIESSLLKTSAKYPMRRIETRFYTHSANSSNISEQNLYTGKLPTRVVVGLVSTLALDGNNTLSPFNFKDFNMQKIELRVNGRALPTADGIKVDMANKLYAQAYASVFLGTGAFFENNSLLSYNDYGNGNFVVLFDLTEDFNNEPTHFHSPNSGTLSLNIVLTTATTESVSIICLLEHEVMLHADSDRNYWLED